MNMKINERYLNKTTKTMCEIISPPIALAGSHSCAPEWVVVEVVESGKQIAWNILDFLQHFEPELSVA